MLSFGLSAYIKRIFSSIKYLGFKGILDSRVSNFRLMKWIFVFGFIIARKRSNHKHMCFFADRIYRMQAVKKFVMVRYIAKELFVYFFVCFLFFFVVFFVNQLLLMAETVLKKRVPVKYVLQLIVYCMPGVVSQSAPFATLVGFLMCLGRLVTDNEVLILRATGHRYGILLVPVLIMGILISLFSFVMNDYFLPLGTLKFNRLYKSIIVSNPAVELESNSIKRLNDSTLIIGEVDKQHVSDLVFFDVKEAKDQRFIVSKDAVVKKSSHDGVLMELDMTSPVVLMMNKNTKRDFDVIVSDELRLNVFEDSIIDTNQQIAPREMTSSDLKKKINRMKALTNVNSKQLNTYILEYNKKFSVPFGSIFFAILAFPLALVFGKKDGQTLGLIFGIIISVMYWAANILGQMFGLRSGYNGFWMMWGPNFFIGIVGFILYLRLRRK